MQAFRILCGLSLPVMLVGCALQKPDAIRQATSEINNRDSQVVLKAIDNLADAGSTVPRRFPSWPRCLPAPIKMCVGTPLGCWTASGPKPRDPPRRPCSSA